MSEQQPVTGETPPNAPAASVPAVAPPVFDSAPDTGASRVIDLEDLIPEELRGAFEKQQEEDEKHHEIPTEPNQPQRSPAAPSPVSEDVDIDLSPDAIDKLLVGEPDAVVKKTDEEAAPFWHEEEDYKAISSRLSNYGVKAEVLDTLIRKVADKSTIDNSKLVNGVQEKLTTTTQELEAIKNETVRLRDIERSVIFDSLDETKSKYGIPMNEAVNDIRTVLEREGVAVPLNKVLGAKNRTELLNLLEDSKLQEKDVIRITDQWRAYRDTETAYFAARNEARQRGVAAVSAKVSLETVGNIFSGSLRTMMKSDERYKYIEQAVAEGVDKHPEVGSLIGMAKTNLHNFITALQAPTEHIHSEKWMAGLAHFVLDAAHNKTVGEKFYTLQKEHTTTLDTLRKVVVEYRKLAQGAKGINGSRTPGFVRRETKKAETENVSQVKEEFESLLKGDNTILDSLLLTK